jgi:hypothetical protein
MEGTTKPAITPDDIAIERELTHDESRAPKNMTDTGMLRAAGQDYPVDGPKPKCDGND